MSNIDTILPDSVTIYRDIAALDVAIATWLDTIPVERLLVYNIDQVDVAALPALAEQFDVLGYKGMRLANTEDDKRQVIKRAIELHKYKGTIWAVKEAMKSVGFADAVINEHVSGHWANFSVTLLNAGVGITDATIADLQKMIEEYKPQRSNLVEINMIILVQDEIIFDEDIPGISQDITSQDDIIFTNGLLYNSTTIYNGSYDHSSDSDLISIT
jgi:phage tail P2-like protein